MTERAWFTSNNALALLDYLYPMRGLDSVEPQSRSVRFYLLACARRAWHELPGICRAVATVAERIYHDRVTDRPLFDEVYPFVEELIHCSGEAGRINAIGQALVGLGHAQRGTVEIEADLEPKSWDGFAHLVYFPFSPATPPFRLVPIRLHSADLVREMFGNPFRYRPPFNRDWRSESVLQLARQAHISGDFSTLPILADALEEAGCDRADVLDHLRSGGPHARGCWVVELVLG
jgi:hypothetical protein